MNRQRSALSLIVPPAEQYDSDSLSYPRLEESVAADFRQEYDQIEAKLESYGSEFWEKISSKDVYRYLPVLSLKIQQATEQEHQQFWSNQFSRATSRIFGRPDAKKASQLVAESSRELKQFANFYDQPTEATDQLFKIYSKIAKPTSDADSTDKLETELLADIKQILYRRYNYVYRVADEFKPDKKRLNGAETRHLFELMLAELAKRDLVWKGWFVSENSSSQMSVSPQKKRINVGRYLPDLSKSRAKGLFTHEVLVHAARTVKGLTYAPSLAYGLPGYTEAEEGLGVLMEAAITGKRPHRIVDRYIDIAMALGILGQPQLSRPELFIIARQRTKLRRLAENSPIADNEIDLIVWQHVNRIYKGTLGNHIVGVNTRDVVYYAGYQNMIEYLSRYPRRDLPNVIRFVLSGKMNPTSQSHRDYIHKLKFNINNQGDA